MMGVTGMWQNRSAAHDIGCGGLSSGFIREAFGLRTIHCPVLHTSF